MGQFPVFFFRVCVWVANYMQYAVNFGIIVVCIVNLDLSGIYKGVDKVR